MAGFSGQPNPGWDQRATRGQDIPGPGEAEREPDTSMFWNLLNHDVRFLIFEELLRAAGTRHHVTSAGQQKARPLMRTRCNDDAFITTATCGHQQCTRGRTESLQDLISLMMTCKTGHLDVSDFLYRNITLVFEDFVVLQKFIQTTCPRYVSLIRRLGFIINAGDADVYHDLHHAFECQPNVLDLFRRFKSLQDLEVNVYLTQTESIPVWPLRDFEKIASAFSKTYITNILFRVPCDWASDSDYSDEDDDYDNTDEDDSNDDYDGEGHHSGDEDGNDVWVLSVVGAATPTNEIIMFDGLEWHRVPPIVPDLPSNALQPYPNMTLLRPVLRGKATCTIFGAANGHDDYFQHREEHRCHLTPRLRKLLQSLPVTEGEVDHGGSTE